MNKLEEINQFLEDADMSTLSADGFDDAILGVANDFNSPPRLVYSITGCIIILMQRDGMNYIDAMEHFGFNVQGSYVGERTPIWVDDCMFVPIDGEL